MQELFINTRYKVVLEREDFKKPYHVINLEYDIVEYKASNLPEALSAAEQMSYILMSETYKAPEIVEAEVVDLPLN